MMSCALSMGIILLYKVLEVLEVSLVESLTQAQDEVLMAATDVEVEYGHYFSHGINAKGAFIKPIKNA